MPTWDQLHPSAEPIYAGGLTRRDYIKVSLLASGGLSLLLSGCSPSPPRGAPFSIVSEWLQALNSDDSSAFEALHSETVFATANFKKDTYTGRDHVWDLFSTSTGRDLEEVVVFGQAHSVCLVANALKFDRSLCYVFNIENDLIAKVYEYSSGRYSLASSPQFSGISVGKGDSEPQAITAVMNDIFVQGLNNRVFSSPNVSQSVVLYIPTASEPVVGRAQFENDGESYAQLFPDVQHTLIESFEQGNLVCTHVSAQDTPRGSLCFLGVFDGREIIELYEFWSDAKV